jgi:hypothetical protein
MMEEVATKSDEVPVLHVTFCFRVLVLALLVAPALHIVSYRDTYLTAARGRKLLHKNVRTS